MTKPRFDNIPTRMKQRPIDHRGFPVPWFVTNKTKAGHWDFVNIDPSRLEQAYRFNLCPLSGVPLGRLVSFVVGPMCIINRISGEPPCIPELGKWAAQVCPFMTQPLARRPQHSLDLVDATPGVMVADNPGGVVVWTVRRSDFFRDSDQLYHFDDPVEVTWWTKGREATPAEAMALFQTRAAKLEAMAAEDGEIAMERFQHMKARAMAYVPRPE